MTHHWAVVLAGGEGTRLAELTRDADGHTVPKQFCSLHEGGSMLHEAVQRAQSVVRGSNVCAVLARQHEPLWRRLLTGLPHVTPLVQPRNCGTANGVLLATLYILARDPLARILFLPADHYVLDEGALAQTLAMALQLLDTSPYELVLLGVRPQTADPELGYIVPGTKRSDGTCSVVRFIEKPALREARRLLRRGALWNSFIFAARAQALINRLSRCYPRVVVEMQGALAAMGRPGTGTRGLEELYRDLPVIDFSRQILQRCDSELTVLAAPPCGWTDLGTPRHLLDTLAHLEYAPRAQTASITTPALVNLSAERARLMMKELRS